LVNVAPAGLRRSNRGLDLIDLGDVDDCVGAFADAEHSSLTLCLGRDQTDHI
jgi:hypothetical protein